MTCKGIRYGTAVYLIFSMVFLMGLWGILAIVTRQAEHAEPLYLAGRQTLFLFCGLAVMEIVRRIPFEFYRKNWFILCFLALFSLLALPHAGERINGMCGWYMVGDISIQPSEIFKIFYILSIIKILYLFRLFFIQ